MQFLLFGRFYKLAVKKNREVTFYIDESWPIYGGSAIEHKALAPIVWPQTAKI